MWLAVDSSFWILSLSMLQNLSYLCHPQSYLRGLFVTTFIKFLCLWFWCVTVLLWFLLLWFAVLFIKFCGPLWSVSGFSGAGLYCSNPSEPALLSWGLSTACFLPVFLPENCHWLCLVYPVLRFSIIIFIIAWIIIFVIIYENSWIKLETGGSLVVEFAVHVIHAII